MAWTSAAKRSSVEPQLGRFGQPRGVLTQCVERGQHPVRIGVAGVFQQRAGGGGVCRAAAYGGERVAVLVGLRRGEYLVEMARDLVAVAVERSKQR